jgi:hypothetical protein
MTFRIIRSSAKYTALCLIPFLSEAAQAQLVFTFLEVGGNVTMTPSGSIDTNDLVAGSYPGWGDAGTQFYEDLCLLGDTRSGAANTGFGFSDGTDYSDFFGASCPFSRDDFTWASTVTKSFSTYQEPQSGVYVPGLNVKASDLVDGVFTPDGTWTVAGTFDSIGLRPGTYSVADAVTGACITVQIGPDSDPDSCDLPSAPSAPSTPATPVPALPLFGLLTLGGLLGLFGLRKLKK